MPRHSPYALVHLNFLASSSLYELLEFHKTNNCYFGFSLQWKGFILFIFDWFTPPFGEIVIFYPNLERPFLILAVSLKFKLSSYLFVSYSSILFIRFSMNVSQSFFLCAWWAQTRIALQRTASYMRSMERFGLFPRNFRCVWWAQVDSNHRPRAYQARALTTWAMSPFSFLGASRLYLHPWWRWRESNPWPPACRAGALPAELHPHVLK